AEFQGDVDNLAYVPTAPLETLKRLKAAGIPTVSVFLSGRPMWTNPEINQSDAFVAAWLPGTEGAGVADLLIGDRAGKPRNDFTGKLS
ncbi:glycoside hydrolase family 3 C-terminal domain-containing protein, partial [Salmonella enterica]